MKKKLLKDVKARRIWTRTPETKIKESIKIYNRQKIKREMVNDLSKM